MQLNCHYIVHIRQQKIRIDYTSMRESICICIQVKIILSFAFVQGYEQYFAGQDINSISQFIVIQYNLFNLVTNKLIGTSFLLSSDMYMVENSSKDNQFKKINTIKWKNRGHHERERERERKERWGWRCIHYSATYDRYKVHLEKHIEQFGQEFKKTI